jgi:hypothetical protein
MFCAALWYLTTNPNSPRSAFSRHYTCSYYLSLAILCVLVVLAIPPAFFGLSNALGRARKENVTFRQLFNNSHNINVLSLSRVFLFGSRDLWFEVPLPFFLRDPASGIGWSRPLTGAFLAVRLLP